MLSIHPTAILSPKVTLGKNVRIGPYSIIEDNVSIGDDTVLLGNVFVGQNTIIGKNNAIHMGSVVGHEAQHLKSKGVNSFLVVGDHNVIREQVTIHRGFADNTTTRVGDHNYFMVNSHIGHDSQIGNHIIMTNDVLLGGHVVVEDHCVIGGGSGIHQFCRLGAYSMTGGVSTVTRDLPPYMLVDDNGDRVGSLNMVGMRRANFSEAAKRDIKNAYKILYLDGLNLTHALEIIQKECHSPEVTKLVKFIKDSKRGILGHRCRRA